MEPTMIEQGEVDFVCDLEMAVKLKHPGEEVSVSVVMPEDRLRAIMHSVGLHRIRKGYSNEGECRTCLIAYKTAYRPLPITDVTAIMSLPRYGLTSNFATVTRAMQPLNIPVMQGFGVYWSEVMTRLMADLEKTNCRYILTIDYDSIFDSSDVRELIRLADVTPEAGAICAVQMRRTKPTALLVMKDGASQVPLTTFDDDLTEILSAHFGLTIIRVETLRKLSKPWFEAKPNPSGEWQDDGYVAADVAFWHKFANEGHKLYQANMVAIGHIEEMVVWPSRRLTPVIQNMDDYRQHGVPDEALR